MAIEVLPLQTASLITINNTICIEHWDYFENEIVSEKVGTLVIFLEKEV